MKVSTVRLIVDSERGEAAWNMALDEALWQGVVRGDGPPTIRIYQWRAPAVSIGRLQRLEDEVDQAACVAAGVEVVRRPTGGGAVCHGDDLTFTLAVPERWSDLPEGILESYARIHSGLIEGLRTIGVSADLATTACRAPSSPRQAGPCFIDPSRYDILWHGRKIVGGAQRRGRGALLHQGTVALSSDPPAWVASVLRKWRSTAVASSNQPLPVSVASVCQAIIRGLERVLGWRAVPGRLTDAERELAGELRSIRYGSVAVAFGCETFQDYGVRCEVSGVGVSTPDT